MSVLKSYKQDVPSSVELFFFGLIFCLILTDILLLVATPTAGIEETIRLLLAIVAFGIVLLGFVLGVLQNPTYAIGVTILSPVVLLYAYTGLLLPWTQLTFYYGQVGVELLLRIPVIGGTLAGALFGGFTLSEVTLHHAFRYHYAVVSLGGIVLTVIVAYWQQAQTSLSDVSSNE